jgi:hypothetical protein
MFLLLIIRLFCVGNVKMKIEVEEEVLEEMLSYIECLNYQKYLEFARKVRK